MSKARVDNFIGIFNMPFKNKYFYFVMPFHSLYNSSFNSLYKQNLILKGNYNRHKYDKTNWYALENEDGLLEMAKPFDTDDKWSELE